MRNTWTRTWIVAVALGLIATVSPAGADVVSDANAKAAEIASKAPGTPPAVRFMAITQVSVFEAVNAVTGKYPAFRAKMTPAPGASIDAAVAAATRSALLKVMPGQQAAIEADYQAALKAIADGPAKDAGIAAGEQAAAQIVQMCADDGFMAPDMYRPHAAAGVYVPTVLPAVPHWGKRRPWVMTKADQFRPGPPPHLKSDTWTRDYNEVKAAGSRASTTRTPEQTATAQFYAPPSFTQFVASIVENAPAPTSVAGSARYYALLYAILVDAAIAHFDSKYTYNFWRPITAIRNGDLDGNPATDPDAGWTSLVESPPHPEYPCAHCNTGTAFATVLAGLVGPGRRVAIRGADNARREFASASEVAADIVNARVYSGIHFRNSAEAGVAMGKQLGEYVLATQLRPLP